jgi:Tol biopolymer transport system component
VRRNSDNGRDTQVALLKLATGEITELTNSHGHRSSPSFSHDGKKLIFARSNKERVSGKTRFSRWDIYETGIEIREERRLTAFQFFQCSSPFYLPDSQHFIFSGEGPVEYVSPAGAKGYNAYNSQFQDNLIFVLSPTEKQSLSPFITNSVFSDFPTISADGSKIVYRARSDQLDPPRPGFTYDLFLFDGKEHKRLTKLDAIIIDTVLSSNGSMSAIVHTRRKQVSNPKLTLFNVDTGQIDSLDPAQLSYKYTADQ